MTRLLGLLKLNVFDINFQKLTEKADLLSFPNQLAKLFTENIVEMQSEAQNKMLKIISNRQTWLCKYLNPFLGKAYFVVILTSKKNL